METYCRPREKLGYGNSWKDWAIRRSVPNDESQVYGTASEIAKVSGCDERNDNLSILKVRSIPKGKLLGIETNFSMESIEQTFSGTGDWGKKVTCTVSRNGDLIHRVFLRVQLPDVSVPADCAFRWLNWVGHILPKSVEVEIGGQRIKNVSAEKYQAPMLTCAA